jgi:hypothetical protein
MFRRTLYVVFALIALVNAVWMLASPESWYTGLPAAVPDTGPYNGHFIRDLGVVFLIIAGGFSWCARHVDRSKPVLIAITLFYVGHAIVHLLDLVSGRLPHSHWGIDTPAVFLPALILVALIFVPQRKPQ